MHDDRQRVHGIPVDEDIQLHERRRPEAGHMVVEGGVAARNGLQLVVEVEHDFVERQFVGDEHPVRRQVLQRFLDAALVLAQLQDSAHVLVGREDHRRDDWLVDPRNPAGVRQLGGAVDLLHLAVGRRHAVQDARRGRHEVDVELTFQPLLHDLHVQQPQEAAAETEAQRDRRLGLVEERRIVQPQLLERIAQFRILVAFDRIEAGEHHRLQFLEPGQRFERPPVGLGDRVADLRVADLLDVGDQEADFADAKLLGRNGLRREDAELLGLVVLPLGHEGDLHALANRAVDHPDDDDHAAVRVVPGVEDQRLERRVRRTGRLRQPLPRSLRESRARRCPSSRWPGSRPSPSSPMMSCDLTTGFLGLRAGQVDLVDDRDDLEVVLDREIRVGERLRLHALRRRPPAAARLRTPPATA